MEEENKENLEEETQNQEEEEQKTFSAEEVKEMIEAEKRKLQSDSERGVQKLLKTSRNYETALNELSKIADDNTHLISLTEENPEIARLILDKYYDGMSIEDYKESIGYEEDLSDPKVFQRKLDLETEKRLKAREMETKTNDFINKLSMTEEEKKQFLEAFAERKELKSFKVEDIDKHLEKAYREISDNEEMIKKLRTTEVIGKSISTSNGNGGGNNDGKSSDGGLNGEISSFLKTYFR